VVLDVLGFDNSMVVARGRQEGRHGENSHEASRRSDPTYQ
jgi:hypothetical protein